MLQQAPMKLQGVGEPLGRDCLLHGWHWCCQQHSTVLAMLWPTGLPAKQGGLLNVCTEL